MFPTIFKPKKKVFFIFYEINGKGNEFARVNEQISIEVQRQFSPMKKNQPKEIEFFSLISNWTTLIKADWDLIDLTKIINCLMSCHEENVRNDIAIVKNGESILSTIC